MPVPRRENHSEEMTDRIRDEQKACSLSGFFLQRKCTFHIHLFYRGYGHGRTISRAGGVSRPGGGCAGLEYYL